MKLKLIYILLSVGLLSSCGNEDIGRDINKLKSKPIVLPINDMQYIFPDENETCYAFGKGELN